MASDSTEPAFDWGDRDDEDKLAPSRRVPAVSEGRRSLAALALFGGLYAVWSIAWVIAIASAPPQPASSVLDAVMYQFGEFLGLVATPLWLGGVWFVTTESTRLTRSLWLTLGLVLLFPLPLVLPVVMG